MTRMRANEQDVRRRCGPGVGARRQKGAERQARNVANYIRQRRTIALCLSTQRVVYQ